jgi:O-methyltransferase
MGSPEAGEALRTDDPVDLYLELLKRTLTRAIYADAEVALDPPRGLIRRVLRLALRRRGITPVRFVPYREDERGEGRDRPALAHTMVGHRRLDQLRRAIEQVIAEDVPGDLIEAGVWRGGASIFMRGVLKAHGVHDRSVWLADSFAGLPPASREYPIDRSAKWHADELLAVDIDEVRAAFERYGLLDDQVKFVKGLFRETLPSLSDQVWAVVRLDGDMYESTMDSLVHLYPRLSPGGFLVVDDYQLPTSRRAVTDFRSAQGISEPIQQIDWTSVYWRRER